MCSIFASPLTELQAFHIQRTDKSLMRNLMRIASRLISRPFFVFFSSRLSSFRDFSRLVPLKLLCVVKSFAEILPFAVQYSRPGIWASQLSPGSWECGAVVVSKSQPEFSSTGKFFCKTLVRRPNRSRAIFRGGVATAPSQGVADTKKVFTSHWKVDVNVSSTGNPQGCFCFFARPHGAGRFSSLSGQIAAYSGPKL